MRSKMANLLDEAVEIASMQYLDRPADGPNPASMRKATQLVQKMLAGSILNTERLALKKILSDLGTSIEEVAMAIEDERR